MKRALADVGSQHMGAACSLFRGEGSCVQCSNGAVSAAHVAAALGEVFPGDPFILGLTLSSQ